MNKKTYMLPGDERIVAGNAKEFVHELRVGSWMDSDCTDEQYMHNFAERYVVQSGVRIAIDTPKKCNGRFPLLLHHPRFPFMGRWGFLYG